MAWYAESCVPLKVLWYQENESLCPVCSFKANSRLAQVEAAPVQALRCTCLTLPWVVSVSNWEKEFK